MFLEPIWLIWVSSEWLVFKRPSVAGFERPLTVLGSERLTGAALDRLTHRCQILETGAESYRLRDAKRRRRAAAAGPPSPVGEIPRALDTEPSGK